jgi:hypothetical protein
MRDQLVDEVLMVAAGAERYQRRVTAEHKEPAQSQWTQSRFRNDHFLQRSCTTL